MPVYKGNNVSGVSEKLTQKSLVLWHLFSWIQLHYLLFVLLDYNDNHAAKTIVMSYSENITLFRLFTHITAPINLIHSYKDYTPLVCYMCVVCQEFNPGSHNLMASSLPLSYKFSPAHLMNETYLVCLSHWNKFIV